LVSIPLKDPNNDDVMSKANDMSFKSSIPEVVDSNLLILSGAALKKHSERNLLLQPGT
jgi:hypothetical protein